jgi:HD-GYP domain-containing protein (c-di-GMP phosphodiesterase class II)
VFQILVSTWADSIRVLGSPRALFWTVLVAATLCVVTATAVIRQSFRTGEADLGILGMFFMSVSALPLVHGITTPGVLYGDNNATSLSVFLSIPIGLASIAPFALRTVLPMTWLRRRWRAWVLGWVGSIAALSAVLLAAPDLFPAPRPRSPLAVTVAIASFIGCVLYSRRHLRMARISARPSTLVVSAGIGMVGASSFVWLVETPLVFGFWVAHVLDIVGVSAATIGALVVYRRTTSVRAVVAPILAVEPLGALEVGLDPIVHRFVADLEAKDPITRDHVVRTAALAIRVGEALRLHPADLRRLGLAAMLHDVGKLEIPDEILHKPSDLTDDEFDVMKSHPLIGERLVGTTFPEIGPGVRGHHERIDGRGYPDGLVGDAIPFDARVVSVCDAFDAMANTRQYRQGMGRDEAIRILREHAGTQWDEQLVATLIAVVGSDVVSIDELAFESVGRGPGADRDTAVDCGCLPVLTH